MQDYTRISMTPWTLCTCTKNLNPRIIIIVTREDVWNAHSPAAMMPDYGSPEVMLYVPPCRAHELLKQDFKKWRNIPPSLLTTIRWKAFFGLLGLSTNQGRHSQGWPDFRSSAMETSAAVIGEWTNTKDWGWNQDADMKTKLLDRIPTLIAKIKPQNSPIQ